MLTTEGALGMPRATNPAPLATQDMAALIDGPLTCCTFPVLTGGTTSRQPVKGSTAVPASHLHIIPHYVCVVEPLRGQPAEVIPVHVVGASNTVTSATQGACNGVVPAVNRHMQSAINSRTLLGTDAQHKAPAHLATATHSAAAPCQQP
jgi:hypothetical protein